LILQSFFDADSFYHTERKSPRDKGFSTTLPRKTLAFSPVLIKDRRIRKTEENGLIKEAHFRYCHHCSGSKIEPLQDNGMRCTDCGYILYHNCAAAVAGIIETIGGIILVKRKLSPKRGYLDLPGGFVDYGESLESVLTREIREEVNIDVTDIRYFSSFPNTYHYRKVTYFTTDAFFVCRSGDSRSLRAKKEVSEITIVRPEEIVLRKIAFTSTRQVLRKYLDVNLPPKTRRCSKKA
jgi:NAD+ diphosphatase